MKTLFLLVVTPSLLGTTIQLASAQTNSAAPVQPAPATSQRPSPAEVPDTSPGWLQPQKVRLNKLSLSYRMGLNITADFNKLGGFERRTDPGPDTGSTYNRNYDQGAYNRVDVSGNAGGLTWYWGYENPNSRINDNTLVFQSEASPNNLSSRDRDDGPEHGVELSYSRELHRGDWYRLGGEVAVAYMPLSIKDRQTLQGQVNRISDTFTAGSGVVVGSPPWHGTFEGPTQEGFPGTLVSSSPERQRTVRSYASTVTGERKLDSDVFVFRLGPYFEIPITQKFSAILNAGGTLLYASSDFSYYENVTIADLGTLTRGNSGSEGDLIFGWYAGATLAYSITEEFGVFAGAQYQAAGRSVSSTPVIRGHAMTSKESVLDLRSSIVLSLGISYAF